jgi:hypothetical protein
MVVLEIYALLNYWFAVMRLLRVIEIWVETAAEWAGTDAAGGE